MKDAPKAGMKAGMKAVSKGNGSRCSTYVKLSESTSHLNDVRIWSRSIWHDSVSCEPISSNVGSGLVRRRKTDVRRDCRAHARSCLVEIPAEI